MLDAVAEILSPILGLVLGPSGWREMSGPAVVCGALIFSLFGILLGGFGWSMVANAGPSSWRLAGLAILPAGLWLLADMAFGVRAFLRANNERK